MFKKGNKILNYRIIFVMIKSIMLYFKGRGSLKMHSGIFLFVSWHYCTIPITVVWLLQPGSEPFRRFTCVNVTNAKSPQLLCSLHWRLYNLVSVPVFYVFIPSFTTQIRNLKWSHSLYIMLNGFQIPPWNWFDSWSLNINVYIYIMYKYSKITLWLKVIS